MDIAFTCENCGQEIVIDEAGAGITVDCPNCGKPVYVPSKASDKPKDAPIRVEAPLAKLMREKGKAFTAPTSNPPPPKTPMTLPGHILALSAGESVTVQARMHPVVLMLPFLSFIGIFVLMYLMFEMIALPMRYVAGTHMGSMAFLIALTPVLLTGMLMEVLAIMARKSTLVTLTNRRLIINQGILSRTTAELLLKQIESVAVRLPLFGRLFGYGTLVVRGTGGGVFNLQYMDDPRRLYFLLQGCIQSPKL